MFEVEEFRVALGFFVVFRVVGSSVLRSGLDLLSEISGFSCKKPQMAWNALCSGDALLACLRKCRIQPR